MFADEIREFIKVRLRINYVGIINVWNGILKSVTSLKCYTKSCSISWVYQGKSEKRLRRLRKWGYNFSPMAKCSMQVIHTAVKVRADGGESPHSWLVYGTNHDASAGWVNPGFKIPVAIAGVRWRRWNWYLWSRTQNSRLEENGK